MVGPIRNLVALIGLAGVFGLITAVSARWAAETVGATSMMLQFTAAKIFDLAMRVDRACAEARR